MDRTEFAAAIYQQLGQAHDAGVREFTCHIPVVSRESNRMTVGMRAKNLPKVPHTVTLHRHPAGFYRAAIESPFGLSCPDPLAAGDAIAGELPDDVVNGPNVSRYEGILLMSLPEEYKLLGADYDGSFSPINGLNLEMRQVFAAQVAGVALKQTTLSPTA